MMFLSINPFTEETITETMPFSDLELENVLDLSHQAFFNWKRENVKKRVSYVQKLGRVLEDQKQELSFLMTKEMGKLRSQSLAEIEKCINLCKYVVNVSSSVLADRRSLPFAPEGSYLTYQALGIVLGVMPWNFPVWQVLRFALPTLMSGNTVLVKHSPNVMGCAESLGKLFNQIFPEGVYQNLPISIKQTEKILVDSRIKGVSLTGSVKAGRSIGALAGKYLKKSLLELGGSDPYLILDTVDLKLAAEQCVQSRMNNNGQSCIAAKRLIVTQKNQEHFISLIVEKMKRFNRGDPLLPETRLGPLARKDLRDTLHKQVRELIRKGAKLLLGGEINSKQRGWFYPPTVLSSLSSVTGVSLYEEELFGPVALIIIVSNEEEAVELANASSYGLGSAVFCSDLKKAKDIAHRLEAGACAINRCLHSDPALPFGGVKNSGYGRELSDLGFYEFVNIKTIRL